jgi:Protein of unknown function (DUF3306)
MSFLTRWSRLKREVAAEKPEKPANAEARPAAELPPVDSLTFESDFSAYLKANVEESVKRAALKKLLHDPRFNVMDGLDTYIDDYTQNEGISEEMLKTLEHARSTLFPPQAEGEQPVETAKADEEQARPQPDDDTRQDT